MHFFNPVPVLPLVELIRSIMTTEEVIDDARGFAEQTLGKQCIDSQDRAGFIVNALLIPYILSAIRMYESGFASKEDIDEGMVLGCAHPMGPLALADLVGLDTVPRRFGLAVRGVPRPRGGRAGAAEPHGRGGPARSQGRARLLRLHVGLIARRAQPSVEPQLLQLPPPPCVGTSVPVQTGHSAG